jgi:hypothetical protein
MLGERIKRLWTNGAWAPWSLFVFGKLKYNILEF